MIELLALLGPALQMGQGIVSGQQGKKAGQQLQKDTNTMKDTLGDFMNKGTSALDYVASQGAQYGGIPGMRGDLMKSAQMGGDQFAGNLMGLMSGMMGDGSAISNIMKSLQGGGANFDFGSGSSIMDEAMSGFDQFSTDSIARGKEDAAKMMTSSSGALDAVLAGRGMATDSGVAGSALADLAREQSGSLVNLQRDLTTMGNQVGLDATKFDIGRVLQEQGMQSNFELGRAGLEGQNLLGAGQLELNRTGQAANLYKDAYTTPLAMQQGMFSENYMNPYMQHQNLMTGMGTDIVGQALAGLVGLMSNQQNNVNQAGAGKGAGLGGGTSQMTNLFTNADFLAALTGE